MIVMALELISLKLYVNVNVNGISVIERAMKTYISESTRVKWDASDDTHSMAQKKARAKWDSRIYIKCLLCEESEFTSWGKRKPGTKDTRHPFRNPSQSPREGRARSEYQRLDTSFRSYL